MSVDTGALKNFQSGKSNFVDDKSKESDYSDLSDDDAQDSLLLSLVTMLMSLVGENNQSDGYQERVYKCNFAVGVL